MRRHHTLRLLLTFTALATAVGCQCAPPDVAMLPVEHDKDVAQGKLHRHDGAGPALANPPVKHGPYADAGAGGAGGTGIRPTGGTHHTPTPAIDAAPNDTMTPDASTSAEVATYDQGMTDDATIAAPGVAANRASPSGASVAAMNAPPVAPASPTATSLRIASNEATTRQPSKPVALPTNSDAAALKDAAPGPMPIRLTALLAGDATTAAPIPGMSGTGGNSTTGPSQAVALHADWPTTEPMPAHATASLSGVASLAAEKRDDAAPVQRVSFIGALTAASTATPSRTASPAHTMAEPKVNTVQQRAAVTGLTMHIRVNDHPLAGWLLQTVPLDELRAQGRRAAQDSATLAREREAELQRVREQRNTLRNSLYDWLLAE